MQKIHQGSYGNFKQEKCGGFSSTRLVGCVVTVKQIRRDGKYPVTINYGTGKLFKKIMTEENTLAAIERATIN